MSYIVQATLAYQHSAPNKGLIHYPGFYIHEIDYMNVLNTKKEGCKILIFLLISVFIVLACLCFFCHKACKG